MKYILAVLLCITFLTLPTDDVYAQQAEEPQTHVVEPRENLFSVARKYGITVQNIRDWNNLETDVLTRGQVLFVSEPPATPEPVEQPSTDTQPESVVEAPKTIIKEDGTKIEPIIHVISRGETLMGLSRLYGVPLSGLREWNKMDSDILSIGQQVVVGFDTTFVQTADIDIADLVVEDEQVELVSPEFFDTLPEDDRLSVETETTTAQFYTVRRGDTLSSISRRFGASLNDLRRWNEIRGDVITVGQELIVGRTVAASVVTGLGIESTAQGRFYEYEMQRNDSIFRILLNHQMDEVDFRALNGGLSPTDVRPGMTVVLLAPPTVSHSNPYLVHVETTSQDSSSDDSPYTGVTLYSDSERGRTTTSGELYNPNHLTAAHQTLPLGSVVHIVNPENEKGVFVLINDRITNRSIKLSRKAYEVLELNRTQEPRVAINTSVN